MAGLAGRSPAAPDTPHVRDRQHTPGGPAPPRSRHLALRGRDQDPGASTSGRWRRSSSTSSRRPRTSAASCARTPTSSSWTASWSSTSTSRASACHATRRSRSAARAAAGSRAAPGRSRARAAGPAAPRGRASGAAPAHRDAAPVAGHRRRAGRGPPGLAGRGGQRHPAHVDPDHAAVHAADQPGRRGAPCPRSRRRRKPKLIKIVLSGTGRRPAPGCRCAGATRNGPRRLRGHPRPGRRPTPSASSARIWIDAGNPSELVASVDGKAHTLSGGSARLPHHARRGPLLLTGQ